MKKKIIAVLLAASIIILPVGVSAAYIDLAREQELSQVKPIMEVIPIKAELEKSFYRGFTGKVTAIDEYQIITDSKIISVENIASSEYKEEARIIISPNTFVLDNTEINIGDIITGFYDASRPMIMIYPPQYNAEVVVVESDKYNVKFDIFNQDLVSTDNFLKLNINEKTELVSWDGKAFTGELTNRKLVVIYDVSTKSIPAQTNPLKVIVLPEVEEMDIVVNNKLIKAPPAYDDGQGIIMVPLRAVAEALGYEVNWNGEEQRIKVGDSVSLKIGVDSYNNTQGKSVQTGIVPSLRDGVTYVPLHFFTEVLELPQTIVTVGQIVIEGK